MIGPCIVSQVYTVIRFVSISAKFWHLHRRGLNGTLKKYVIGTLECAYFTFNKCVILDPRRCKDLNLALIETKRITMCTKLPPFQTSHNMKKNPNTPSVLCILLDVCIVLFSGLLFSTLQWHFDTSHCGAGRQGGRGAGRGWAGRRWAGLVEAGCSGTNMSLPKNVKHRDGMDTLEY